MLLSEYAAEVNYILTSWSTIYIVWSVKILKTAKINLTCYLPNYNKNVLPTIQHL